MAKVFGLGIVTCDSKTSLERASSESEEGEFVHNVDEDLTPERLVKVKSIVESYKQGTKPNEHRALRFVNVPNGRPEGLLQLLSALFARGSLLGKARLFSTENIFVQSKN